VKEKRGKVHAVGAEHEHRGVSQNALEVEAGLDPFLEIPKLHSVE
jgi:hypothetical protein